MHRAEGVAKRYNCQTKVDFHAMFYSKIRVSPRVWKNNVENIMDLNAFLA